MNLHIGLKAGRYENRTVIVFEAIDPLGRYVLLTPDNPAHIDQLRSLLPWPELIDVVLAKAEAEYQRLGPAPRAESGAILARYSECLKTDAEISLNELHALYQQIGGMFATGLFPEPSRV